MNRLIVPGTGVVLHDGSIVILNRFPGTKWIVHNGWYNYMGQQYMGWYFCSIPSQTILPVSDDDLSMLTVVSDGECPCPPHPPMPPHPFPDVPFTPQQAFELDRAWISVETIAQRDQLNKRLLPNGKIVRVNNIGGRAEYYIWNQVTQTWEDETFGINLTEYLTKKEADAKYVSQENFSQDVSDAIKNDPEVKDTITQQVDEAMKPVKDQVDSLETTVNNMNTKVEHLETVVNQLEWINI